MAVDGHAVVVAHRGLEGEHRAAIRTDIDLALPIVNITGDITTGQNAQTAIGNLDSAILLITGHRATFGAKQNQLESAVRNLENVAENQSAARSRIQDADFAMETANLTRTQILQQAGAAMLAQANAMPQNVLSLLR